MLVLTRKLQQQIVIGGEIIITILRIRGDRVRVGITAPDGTRIMRSELLEGDDPFKSRGKALNSSGSTKETAPAPTPAGEERADRPSEESTVSEQAGKKPALRRDFSANRWFPPVQREKKTPTSGTMKQHVQAVRGAPAIRREERLSPRTLRFLSNAPRASGG